MLFTDRVGSTEQREQLGDQEGNALRRAHDTLLREQIAGTGGREVKHLGDGLMVTFPSARDALACAVKIQQAVHRHNQQQKDDAHRLHVRVGLHVGEPAHEEGDYFGSAVDIAKRLCDSAEGGQIILSDLVRGVAAGQSGHSYRALGALTLKGITEPLSASELLWAPAAETPTPAAETPAKLLLTSLFASREQTAFVGREQELAALEQSWALAQSERRQLVMLAGEPGIGKTRLAAQFSMLVQERGARVLYGRCDEESVVRCQPFVEALRPIASSLAGELADVFRDEDQTGRYALFQRVEAVLAELAPAALVLDDLHWADRAALQLLRHVMKSSQQPGLLCIGTYRDTETERSHPLNDLLADLRRDRLVQRTTLSGLDPAESRQLIEAASAATASPDLARELYERTEGNPFFIEELLRDFAEEHGNALPAGAARGVSVPEGVKDVIGRRLARLSDECNSVLTIAAVIGREFGIAGLARASDLPEERLAAALEDAVNARLVDEVAGTADRYAFSHALTRETLYDELSATRRVRLHGQTLQYADSNGVKLAYEVLGHAGPHVIVVGVTNCPAVRPRVWRLDKRWERIVQRMRVILYDRRGVGYSAAPERGYSLLASVEDLRAVLDAAGVERAVVWGPTDGGPLAIAFASQYPERVAGLLLTGTSARITNAPDFSHGMDPALLQAFLQTDAVDPGRAVSELIERRYYAPGDTEALVEVVRRVPRRVWAKIMGGIGGADARPFLERVQAPTLILHDPDNNYLPLSAAHFLHEHIAGSQLRVLEEYARPVWDETVYEIIESFIARVTSPRE